MNTYINIDHTIALINSTHSVHHSTVEPGKSCIRISTIDIRKQNIQLKYQSEIFAFISRFLFSGFHFISFFFPIYFYFDNMGKRGKIGYVQILNRIKEDEYEPIHTALKIK